MRSWERNLHCQRWPGSTLLRKQQPQYTRTCPDRFFSAEAAWRIRMTMFWDVDTNRSCSPKPGPAQLPQTVSVFLRLSQTTHGFPRQSAGGPRTNLPGYPSVLPAVTGSCSCSWSGSTDMGQLTTRTSWWEFFHQSELTGLLQHLWIKQALWRLTEPFTKTFSLNPLMAGCLVTCVIKAIAGSKASSHHSSLFLFLLTPYMNFPFSLFYWSWTIFKGLSVWTDIFKRCFLFTLQAHKWCSAWWSWWCFYFCLVFDPKAELVQGTQQTNSSTNPACRIG